MGPDTKTQVTCEYYFENGACIPTRVHTVVVSCQHSEKVTLEALRKDIMEKVVLTTIPKQYITPETKYHINPCGNFVIGGPMGDAGLTGRKIIVDTYGGWGAHGGGAFSGKDYTKVDRSAAYAARWVAEPLSVTVFDYGTGAKSSAELNEIVKKNFDLRPGRIVKDLKLKNPIFQQTASYGHFGRDIFTWEQPKNLSF